VTLRNVNYPKRLSVVGTVVAFLLASVLRVIISLVMDSLQTIYEEPRKMFLSLGKIMAEGSTVLLD
jgi:hypothetical protein